MGLHALLREKYPLLAKNLFKKYIPSALKVFCFRHLNSNYENDKPLNLFLPKIDESYYFL